MRGAGSMAISLLTKIKALKVGELNLATGESKARSMGEKWE
jgi:hypothetical protein